MQLIGLLVIMSVFAGLHVISSSVVQIIEKKTEPEFKFGKRTEVLSCNITLSSGNALRRYNVSWYRGLVLVNDLPQGSRFRAVNNSLIIDKPKRSDASLYRATFMSLDGEFSDHYCYVRYLAKPLVLDFPRSINTAESDSLDLRCMVLGYPIPNVTWYRNGINIMSEISNESHIRTDEYYSINKARLIITRVRKEDAGIYKCEAYSSFFNYTSSKELKIRVQDKLAAMWPLIGIVASAIVLCLTIMSFEANAKRRIQREEALLYRESFMNLAAAAR